MIDYAQFDRAIGLNFYEVDPDLQDTVRRLTGPDELPEADAKLREVGALCGGPIAERAEITDRNPAKLVRYDRWGTEVGRVEHHPTALATKRDWYEHVLSVPLRTGRPLPGGVASACAYMLDQAETGMSCSIGMTAGVAELVDLFGSQAVKDTLMPRLRATRWEDYWDGSMFLTERDGGSDLGAATKTTATHVDGDLWVLNGFKWFCSNVDGDVIATLARPVGAPDGVAGIALFVVPRERRDGSPNGVVIRRIKDKLGTRAVPTGEVDFVDAEAYILAGGSAEHDGKGMHRMMSGMVQGSRLGVGFMGLGIARRSFLEAAIYAAHRRAFSNRIDAFPMVRETLVRMVMELEAASALCFEAVAARMRGDDALWRIVPALAKYRATRRGLQLATAAIEIHGGNGYIEDWPLARQLRDAQCHPIWEGTENIIALDVLRALGRDGVLEPLLARVRDAIGPADDAIAGPLATEIDAYANTVREAIAVVAAAPKDVAQLHARRITRGLANLTSAALLTEQARLELDERSSARKASLASLYVAAHLRARSLLPDRGAERIVLDLFEPITRYGEVAPDRLVGVAG